MMDSKKKKKNQGGQYKHIYKKIYNTKMSLGNETVKRSGGARTMEG